MPPFSPLPPYCGPLPILGFQFLIHLLLFPLSSIILQVYNPLYHALTALCWFTTLAYVHLLLLHIHPNIPCRILTVGA
ncbi:hypothetical protein EV426DRAFT_597057 [Tirmania nivea]|nr:hypothetical protein EV426DRAFT_597057 [Tirmania nivea]